ncbi:MAG: hypothetical protein KBC06_02855 [Candidatus Pacebacteria bacterium]|nr:hypothetical protein [Candidatus Paceibacterota bacterium]
MKKILLSLGIIAVVAIVAVNATGAFFSDTETSTGNTFTAGAIDLKIDSASTYNGVVVPSATWALKDLVPTSDKFFNFGDIKPGDVGTTTISLHVINNDAWACAVVSNLTNFENGQSEPEASVDATVGTNDGELQSKMLWTIWKDTNSNGVQDGGEATLASGNPTNGSLALYDSTTGGGPLLPADTAYIGVSWTLPSSTGNETQTDSMTGDISFHVEQSRNNGSFKCSDLGQQEPQIIWVETSQTGADASIVVEEPRGNVLKLETIADNDSRVRWTNSTLNLNLSTFTGISYDSKQVSAADLVNGNATMRLVIDLDGDVYTADTEEITYEPYYNIFAHNSLNDVSILANTWQTWDTTMANGKFWGNGGFLGTTPSGGAYATNITLAQVLAAHPSAKIVEISLGMGTWNPNQVILVDNLMINGSPYSLEN